MSTFPWTTGLLVVSDRASQGIYQDQTGPALHAHAQAEGWNPSPPVIVPDEIEAITQAFLELTQTGHRLILVSGGTGVGPRDVTPEALRPLLRCELAGFGERMRAMAPTPLAILSRTFAGIAGQALVLVLPGKPQAALENIRAVQDVIPHALRQLQGEADHGTVAS